MKTILSIIVLVTSGVISSAPPTLAQYYYSNNKQIKLHIDSSRVLVRFHDPNETQPDQWADAIDRIESHLTDSHAIDDYQVFSLKSKYGYDTFLDSLSNLSTVKMVEPYYTDPRDSAHVLGDRFCVAFSDGVTRKQIDSLNSLYGVEMGYPVAYMGNVFTLHNTEKSGKGTLEVANMYYGLRATIFSHPLFSVGPVQCNYMIFDEYHNHQAHLKKVIGSFNDKSVWDFYGLTDPVVVAVVDDGVTSHEDLPAERILPGHDFADGDNNPAPAFIKTAHGMSCAGLIGASHKTSLHLPPASNESGIFSVSPHTLIKPVKIYRNDGSSAGVDSIASAISYAWKEGVDILSCSWSYFGDYSYEYDIVLFAIDSAYHFGRDGKGCPVIVATGNFAQWAPGYLFFPANIPQTFAVGATDLMDQRWYYSQYGIALNAVAPSGEICGPGDRIWSIDQMDEDGFNPDAYICYEDWQCSYLNDESYNCQFGGTSASAAIVSGISALILSFNDTLTSNQVYDILKFSADPNVGSSPPITPPDFEYGWGRVDAFRAILSLARGDMNADGKKNLSDITWLQSYIYSSGPDAFPDYRLGNCDCDPAGNINLSDVTLLIDHIYVSKDPLPLPCFVY